MELEVSRQKTTKGSPGSLRARRPDSSVSIGGRAARFSERGPVREALYTVAPEPVLRHALGSNERLTYQTTDLILADVEFPGDKLEALIFPSGSYDLVPCNRVVEHISRDDLAVAEIPRILGPSGIAVITIPGNRHRTRTVIFPDTVMNRHYRGCSLDVQYLFLTRFEAVERNLHEFDRSPGGLRAGINKTEVAFVGRMRRR